MTETSRHVARTAAEGSVRPPSLIRGLSLLDSLLLLVSGVIGSSIFLTARDIAKPLPSPLLFLLVWLLGGMLSLFAGFAFGELGSMFPTSGGQYVYLREAYGDLTAFLFGWMTFTVNNGGTIAALAVASALYMGSVIPSIGAGKIVIAAGSLVITRAHVVALFSIFVVTCINIGGLRRGAVLQNTTTLVKFVAIAVFVLLGVTIGKGNWQNFALHSNDAVHGVAGLPLSEVPTAFGVALIAVFWAYDGWAYITWVAGEVKNPRRNIPLTMTLGIATVTLIYVAMSATYVYSLPINEIAKHDAIVYSSASVMFSPRYGIVLSAMIAVSSFGAMATCVLSGSRVYYAMALDGIFFRKMAAVHPRWRTPVFSLAGQGMWAALLTISGRYDQLYTYVMFMTVVAYTLTVAGLFVLRRKRPNAERPYLCFGYPWLPGIYILIGIWWTINTLITRPMESITGVFVVLLGVPAYLYWKRSNHPTKVLPSA